MKIGSKHTEATKRKMSETRKGRVLSEEARKNMSKALKGHIVSEETKRKIIKPIFFLVSSDTILPL